MGQPLAWHHFRFEIPTDWELTNFATDPEQGGLTFANRHGFQGVVRWQRHPRPPDIRREMVLYLQTRVLKRKARRIRDSSGFEETTVNGFTLLRHASAPLPIQAMRYLPDTRVTVHWSLPDSSPEGVRRRATPLLESFAPNTGDPRHYALLGIRCEVPARFAVTQIDALPANVRLMFVDGSHTVAVRRWGLLAQILQDRLPADFYRRELEGDGAVCDTESRVTSGPAQTTTITFHERPDTSGHRRLRRPVTRHGTGTVWHDAREHRVYAVEQRWTGDTQPLDPARICPALRTHGGPDGP